MKPKSIEQQLESLNIHPDEIPDEDISDVINLLFQLIEELHLTFRTSHWAFNRIYFC